MYSDKCTFIYVYVPHYRVRVGWGGVFEGVMFEGGGGGYVCAASFGPS